MNIKQKKRFDFGNQFIQEIKTIIARNFYASTAEVEDATKEEDCLEATDLKLGDLRFMVRVRRASQIQYKGQFTLRHDPRPGHKTELQKVRQGWGDYMIYGFADAGGKKLSEWIIVDLGAWRYQTREHYGEIAPPTRRDVSGDCSFFAFNVEGFLPSPRIVVASSEALGDETGIKTPQNPSAA